METSPHENEEESREKLRALIINQIDQYFQTSRIALLGNLGISIFVALILFTPTQAIPTALGVFLLSNLWIHGPNTLWGLIFNDKDLFTKGLNTYVDKLRVSKIKKILDQHRKAQQKND